MRHKPCRAHQAQLEGTEAWYMPAAGVRGRLRRILALADFIARSDGLTDVDRLAVEGIRREAVAGLGSLEEFVAEWFGFWRMVYDRLQEPARLVEYLRAASRAAQGGG